MTGRYLGTALFLVFVFWFVKIITAAAIVIACLIPFCLLYLSMASDLNKSETKPNKKKRKPPSEPDFSELLNSEAVQQRITAQSSSNEVQLNDKTKTILSDIKKNGGLIIKQPWIDLILSGKKTWEMRATRYKKRGYIALIGQGRGAILGIAKINGYSERLSTAELQMHQNKHCVPASIYECENYKWFVAMYLSNIVRFDSTITYKPNKGAVIWTKLNQQEEVLAEIRKQIQAKTSKPKPKPKATESAKVASVDTSAQWLKGLIKEKKVVSKARAKIPISKDGIAFEHDIVFKDGLIHLKQGQQEFRFDSYHKALSALRREPSLTWRCFKCSKQGWKETESWLKRE